MKIRRRCSMLFAAPLLYFEAIPEADAAATPPP